MKYNFEKIIDRSGTNSMAIEINPIPDSQTKEAFSKIPMWVADMNFDTAPSIPEEIKKRADHPLYGYFALDDEYYDAIIGWHKKRKGVEDLEYKHIGYENGVLGGLASAVGVLASSGDNILVHSPTYIGFTMSMTNKGYNLVHSPLYLDDQGVWRMDYEDMERKIIEMGIHTAIFCNPHNPTGRAWTKEEIKKAYDIFEKHDVYVISDEIWSDLLLEENTYTPSQAVNDIAKNRTIALYAPSKTFNLAGLVGSYHIIYNDWLRDRHLKESSLSHYNNPNVLSAAALVGAYSDTGDEWLNELNAVLSQNVKSAYNFIKENFKGIKVHMPEATYLLYLDCSQWLEENNMSIDDLQRLGVEYGVIWQDGRPFGIDNSIRMNFALPYSQVVEAMDRLDKYVFNKK